MSTEPQDPNDPQDPNNPQDPKNSSSMDEDAVAENEGSSVYELEPEPTMDLDEDAAITEEVSSDTMTQAPPPVSSAPQVVPIRSTGFEPTPSNSVPGPSTVSPPSTGRYVRFGIVLGIGLGLVLGIPVCGDIASWALPPVLGGILLVLYASRWQGPAALDPQRLSMGAAMMGLHGWNRDRGTRHSSLDEPRSDSSRTHDCWTRAVQFGPSIDGRHGLLVAADSVDLRWTLDTVCSLDPVQTAIGAFLKVEHQLELRKPLDDLEARVVHLMLERPDDYSKD